MYKHKSIDYKLTLEEKKEKRAYNTETYTMTYKKIEINNYEILLITIDLIK